MPGLRIVHCHISVQLCNIWCSVAEAMFLRHSQSHWLSSLGLRSEITFGRFVLITAEGVVLTVGDDIKISHTTIVCDVSPGLTLHCTYAEERRDMLCVSR